MDTDPNSWHVRVETSPSWPSVGVYYRADGMLRSACAEAQLWRGTAVDDVSIAGPVWWINRVLVPKSLRGKGLGRELLRRLKGAVTAQGGKGMIVTPGGYDIPQGDQIAFYRACDFEVVREEDTGVLMRWVEYGSVSK